MLPFPLNTLLAEQACYDVLLQGVHPRGVACPVGHLLPPAHAPPERQRAPSLDARCRTGGAVVNLCTNALCSKPRYGCSTSVLLRRGSAQGPPTKHLADELGIDRR